MTIALTALLALVRLDLGTFFLFATTHKYYLLGPV